MCIEIYVVDNIQRSKNILSLQAFILYKVLDNVTFNYVKYVEVMNTGKAEVFSK